MAERFEVLQIVEQMHKALRDGTHKDLAERYRASHPRTFELERLITNALIILEDIK